MTMWKADATQRRVLTAPTWGFIDFSFGPWRCWNWTGPLDRNGYGSVYVGNVRYKMQRARGSSGQALSGRSQMKPEELAEKWEDEFYDAKGMDITVSEAILGALRELQAAHDAEAHDTTLDATDGAHPAWWRGHDDGARGIREKLQAAHEKDRANASAYLQGLLIERDQLRARLAEAERLLRLYASGHIDVDACLAASGPTVMKRAQVLRGSRPEMAEASTNSAAGAGEKTGGNEGAGNAGGVANTPAPHERPAPAEPAKERHAFVGGPHDHERNGCSTRGCPCQKPDGAILVCGLPPSDQVHK